MTLDHLTRTLNALLNARVRMLIAGGLAVLAHGHRRVTHDFETEWTNAARISLPGFPENLPFVSKPTLLAMKRKAARSIDMDDIKHLEHIR